MKSLYEKLNINKDTKIKRSDLYSFYEKDSDIREGDKVLFPCRSGDGSSIFVKCIVSEIVYAKDHGKLTDIVYKVNLKLDDSNIRWIKEDNTVKEFINKGVSGYKTSLQLLKLED